MTTPIMDLVCKSPCNNMKFCETPFFSIEDFSKWKFEILHSLATKHILVSFQNLETPMFGHLVPIAGLVGLHILNIVLSTLQLI